MTIKMIAELGSNPAAYGWDFTEFCRAADFAGATHVKIQLWKTTHFPASEWATKRLLEFPRALLPDFVAQAHRRMLKAGASVFDEEAVELTAVQCDFLKLACREQANNALIAQAVRSTLRYDRTLYRTTDNERHDLRLMGVTGTELFTVARYPTRMIIAWLGVLRAARFFGRMDVAWGWSSHTTGVLDCVLAARLGASVIEKHLCLDKADPEGGHSLLPDEFEHMVSQIRRMTS